MVKKEQFLYEKLDTFSELGGLKREVPDFIIKNLNQKFDAVFLDPFSPKKCPELWTERFFKDIRKLMKQNSVLTTYSCAKITRNNLVNAGFNVKDGPSIGRRAPSTIAYAL